MTNENLKKELEKISNGWKAGGTTSEEMCGLIEKAIESAISELTPIKKELVTLNMDSETAYWLSYQKDAGGLVSRLVYDYRENRK